MSYYLNSSASITADPFGLLDHYFDSIDFFNGKISFSAAPRAGSHCIHSIIHPRRSPQAESRRNRRARRGEAED